MEQRFTVTIQGLSAFELAEVISAAGNGFTVDKPVTVTEEKPETRGGKVTVKVEVTQG